MLELNADCFEHKVGKLLNRYQDKHSKHKSNHWQSCSLKDQSMTPDAYLHALIVGYGVTSGRFASPLNFNPAMNSYYSIFDQDRVFGATVNVFSTHLKQTQTMNPNAWKRQYAGPSSMQSNLKPSLTVFVLPRQTSSGYCKWPSHPTVRQLCTINKQAFRIQTVNLW